MVRSAMMRSVRPGDCILEAAVRLTGVHCMKITTARFLTAAENPRSYPRGGLTELAFAGRSNVGKSSTINALLGRHHLVKTSRTPGHTRKLNFFLINDRFIFVDFPGYGFARVPTEIKKHWGPMVETYLQQRKELAGVVVVVDVRVAPTETDTQLIGFLKSHNTPLILVATKADKLPHGKRIAQLREIQEKVGGDLPVVIFSSRTGLGKNELWKQVKSLIECWRPEGNDRSVARVGARSRELTENEEGKERPHG